jgi:hypothetical protein
MAEHAMMAEHATHATHGTKAHRASHARAPQRTHTMKKKSLASTERAQLQSLAKADKTKG